VSPRGRLLFAGVCLLAFGLVAAWVVASPSGRSGAPVAPAAPGGARPAVVDLSDAGQLQARFNADKGVPRLVLALSPT
jgi:hypothetical protein